jgi:3-hydroxyisobutyrate dehydrogenase
MRIGFIGLGSMGGDQARLLAKAYGADLTVYDVSAEAMKAVGGKAKMAASLGDVGRDADVVSVCVRDDQQVRDVLESKGGLFETMPKGSVILIHSTVKPKTVIDLAAKAASKNITLIDAPVSRTVIGGDGPFVITMTGGDEAVTERVRPILEKFSTDILHVGRLGSAMVLKITNNLVSWTSIVVARQAFDLAEAGGVPAEKLTHVMKQNGNLTPTSGGYIQMPARFKGTKDELKAFFASQAGIGEKDLELAATTGAELGAKVPSATHAKDLVRHAMSIR